MQTLHATLYGAPNCRRYRRTKQRLLEAAAASGMTVVLEEISDAAQLARFNPLALPLLYVEGERLASRNPPSVEALKRLLQAYDHD